MEGRPKVVVDVQFQGRETEYEIIQEQFEFELVGNRIHVRPCAADHPQVAGYPRKRPASPRNEPIEVSRVKSKSQELQSRSPRLKSRSPSPTRSQLVEKQTVRYRDRSTSPCFSRKMPHEDSEERFPPNRRRAQRVNVNRDDSYTNFSTPRVVRPQPRQLRKETSMWHISKKGSDNYSIESSASLGDVNCGSLQYCLQQDNDGSYTFTGRSKNIDSTKRGRRNLAVQAGYDEDLRFKRLKQFSNGRKKYETYQRNKPIGREIARPRYGRHDFDLNDEPKANRRQCNRETKKCMYSCQPCGSNETPPSVLFEECEMFASSETIRYEADKYEEDDEDEEEDLKKNYQNKNSDKRKMKPSKRNPHKSTSSLLSVNLKPQASKEKFKPEEDDELEVKESKRKEQKQKKKDKDTSEDRQKSKKDKTSKKNVVIKVEDTDDDENEEVPLKAVAQSKNRLSPERAKKKEEKEGRRSSAQPRNKRSPERAKKKAEREEEEENTPQSKNRSSPEGKKVKEEKKTIKQTNLAMTRNCCRKALLYKRAHFADDDEKEE